MTGLVHIYCGDGKGKTTAAVGSAVRAAGRGKKVLIVRFLKTDDSGEVLALSFIPGITLLPCRRNFGFTWEMSPEKREAAAVYYRGIFANAWSMASGRDGGDAFDMLVMDEVLGACKMGFLDEEALIRQIRHKPAGLEVILTGRGPSEPMQACADYITEMANRRHPYEKGVPAREGIEY